MRRAILAVVVTAIGLVLLMSFKPQDITAAADRPAVVSGNGSGTGGGETTRADPAPGGSGIHDEDDEDDEEEEGDDDEGLARGRGDQAGSGGGASSGGGGSTGTASGGSAVTGDVADTRWGPVQVRISVSGGRIADVRVLRSPDGNHRDIEINRVALPILVQETLDAQSAAIDVVSGATYTSDGYIRSLQSAIDRAGL